METPKGHDRKVLVCLYEFLGQIFFMYAVLVSGASGSDIWGITGPLALFAIVSIFGAVSGGHFNPAVTLGVYTREAKWADNFIFLLMIWSSQILGAIVGMMLAYLVIRIEKDGDYTVLPAQVPLLLPSTITKDMIDSGTVELKEQWATFYMEVICTAIFVGYIIHVTGKRTVGPDLGIWGLPTICLVLWALCSVDHFTGASFNPALAIGMTIFQYTFYPTNPSNVMWHYLPLYVFGALGGGLLAGLIYNQHKKMWSEKDDQVHRVNDSDPMARQPLGKQMP